MSLYDASKKASLEVDEIEKSHGNRNYYARTVYSVLASAMSEFGELSEEVMINQNHSYKKKGDDGVIGEAIDAIACLLDMIHKADPTIDERYLQALMTQKCTKWVDKVRQHKGL